jgi:hypothetical protein
MPLTRPTRASRLIDRLLMRQCFSEEELAAELVVSVETLADYRAGRVPMPLERQLCLAVLTIAKAPAFARLGRELRYQVTATIAYEMKATETHDAPPARWRRPTTESRVPPPQ